MTTRREFLNASALIAGTLALGFAAKAGATPEFNGVAGFSPYPSLSFLPQMHTDAWKQFPLIDYNHGPASLIREVCSTNKLIAPILYGAFTGQFKDKLAGKPPPLLGNFIMEQFNSCFIAVHEHFPKDYTEEERVRTAADLTVFTLAGISFPYFSPEQVMSTFKVQLPKIIVDNAPPMFLKDDAFINLTASQLPHIYPAPPSGCSDELDRVLRCYGQIDRNSHFTFHLIIAYWFLKSLAAKDPNIARMPNALSWATKLGSTPSQKAEILEYAVGRGWETIETGKALWEIFAALSLWKNTEKDNEVFLESLKSFDKTGWFDKFVRNDYLANGFGAQVACLFAQARTIKDIEEIRQVANSPFINSTGNRLSLTTP